MRHVRRLRGPAQADRIAAAALAGPEPLRSLSVNHAILFEYDYCATTHRRCDVVCWPIWFQKSVETGLEGVVLKVRDRPSRCGLICSDVVEGTRT
jgi:hypothetical protein